MKIKENYSLKKLNTFNIDVSAKYFIAVKTENEILKLINDESLTTEKKVILGGGSNILFTKDFDGIIIKNEIPGIEIIEESNGDVLVKAGGGVVWDDFVSYAVENGFGGVENLTYIPGTVGAAPIQNIGAYGVEQQDVFHSAEALFLKDGIKKTFNKDESKFGYRSSVFKSAYRNKLIITSVIYRLTKNPIPNISYRALASEFENRDVKSITIKEINDTVKNIRKSKLPEPSVIGNAGSFFKNPEINKFRFDRLKKEYKDIVYYKIDDNTIKIPAGWLIEKCKFKGRKFGNTGTYKNQALVIVNYGDATGEEIVEFSRKIQHAVYEKFNIDIRPEVNII
ncbi:MAG: UDP-N-acetylmuramate dehydrogenase [Melioribacteraceae bacterium]|nr:UDP-N-acetylmuramate dehydrogenase [Melioribacteraceae bacterium]